MESKAPKVSLDNLPPSTDGDFWDGEVNTNIVPERFFDNNHYFERVDGRNAQCKNCSWGFALDVGDKIKEGHLYDKSGKLVI